MSADVPFKVKYLRLVEEEITVYTVTKRRCQTKSRTITWCS